MDEACDVFKVKLQRAFEEERPHLRTNKLCEARIVLEQITLRIRELEKFIMKEEGR